MGVKFGTEEGTFGPLLRAKFHPHRCNVSPLRGENPQNRPLSKLNNRHFALRAMLPVNENSDVIFVAAQNDVLCLTLAESKDNCNHLTMLLGKYESSVTAHQMTTSYADQALSAYQVLVGLLDTELALLTSKCQILGICGYGMS